IAHRTRMATVGNDMELNDLLDFSVVSRRDCSSSKQKRPLSGHTRVFIRPILYLTAFLLRI
uniref:Uncharacterized protein n=1 Tax=Sinocyclocheilus grahami TaxID=75366 RepID=A0A672LRP1_SINGR